MFERLFLSVRRLTLLLAMLAGSLTGCGVFPPDQSQFDDLQTAADADHAIVRVCSEQVTGIPLCFHSWLLTKPADAHEFDRWEVAGAYWGDHGHVAKNIAPSMHLNGEFYVANVRAELTGPPAQKVIAFLETHATAYPSRNYFILVAGPNCNTFVQWVCDHSGWGWQMPIGAFGAWAPQVTPDRENHDVW